MLEDNDIRSECIKRDLAKVLDVNMNVVEERAKIEKLCDDYEEFVREEKR